MPFSGFQVCFWQPKTSRCAPGAGWACQGTNTRQIPAWGSSTPQHGQKRRRRKDEDFLVQKSLALWPPKFTVRSERNVLPSSFSCFLFFFVARLPVGENTSLLPCGSNTSSAQGASGKHGPDLLALFERRDWISSQNNASTPKGVPCRRRALFVIMGNKVEQTQQTKLSLQVVGLVVFLKPGKAKSLLCITWQTYRQGYKPQRLYK